MYNKKKTFTRTAHKKDKRKKKKKLTTIVTYKEKVIEVKRIKKVLNFSIN